MADDTPPIPMTETEYWKKSSNRYLERLKELRKKFDEFVVQSSEMELDMDAKLLEKQKRIHALEIQTSISEQENADLKEKLKAKSIEMSTMANQLAEMTQKFEAKKVEGIFEQITDNQESNDIVEGLLSEEYKPSCIPAMLALVEQYELNQELQRLSDEALRIEDLRDNLKLCLIKPPVDSDPVATQVARGKTLELAVSFLLEEYKKEALLEQEVENNEQELEEDQEVLRDEVVVLREELHLKKLPRMPVKSVTFASQVGGGDGDDGDGDSVKEDKSGSEGSMFQLKVRKMVSGLVNKLVNLKARLGPRREKKPLPSAL